MADEECQCSYYSNADVSDCEVTYAEPLLWHGQMDWNGERYEAVFARFPERVPMPPNDPWVKVTPPQTTALVIAPSLS